jgi:hypothetical protein
MNARQPVPIKSLPVTKNLLPYTWTTPARESSKKPLANIGHTIPDFAGKKGLLRFAAVPSQKYPARKLFKSMTDFILFKRLYDYYNSLNLCLLVKTHLKKLQDVFLILIFSFCFSFIWSWTNNY